MKDIPYEIWQHITTFLHSNEVKALLSVNRPLFDIAMNERYHTAFIVRSSKSLKRLSDKDVTARVRTLHFEPSIQLISSLYPEPQKQNKSTAKGRKISEKVRSRMKILVSSGDVSQLSSPMDSQEVAECLRKIMNQLSSLNYLTIELYAGTHVHISDNPKPMADLFALGWSAFGHTLQTLHVKTPLEDMSAILPGTAMLKNLKNIYISLTSCAIGQPTQNIPTNAAHLLLQTNCNSLRSLTISCVDQRLHLGLLNDLSFPRLSHFQVILFAKRRDEATVHGLYGFFRRNRDHLLDLTVFIQSNRFHDSYNIPTDVLSWQCFLLSLPRVENLTIKDWSYNSRGEHSLSRYVHQFKDNLCSLTLQRGGTYDLDTVAMITEGLATASRLTEINFTVSKLDLSLLATLASNLPNLGKLCLDVAVVDPFPIQNVEDITKKVPENSPLFQWHLKTLDICILGNTPLSSLESGKVWSMALLEILPDLSSVCELIREEV